MPQTIREKIIKILRQRLDEGVYFDIIIDQILSLIIESLPEEITKNNNIKLGNSQPHQIRVSKMSGYNAYREELIKMLKGI